MSPSKRPSPSAGSNTSQRKPPLHDASFTPPLKLRAKATFRARLASSSHITLPLFPSSSSLSSMALSPSPSPSPSPIKPRAGVPQIRVTPSTPAAPVRMFQRLGASAAVYTNEVDGLTMGANDEDDDSEAESIAQRRRDGSRSSDDDDLPLRVGLSRKFSLDSLSGNEGDTESDCELAGARIIALPPLTMAHGDEDEDEGELRTWRMTLVKSASSPELPPSPSFEQLFAPSALHPLSHPKGSIRSVSASWGTPPSSLSLASRPAPWHSTAISSQHQSKTSKELGFNLKDWAAGVAEAASAGVGSGEMMSPFGSPVAMSFSSSGAGEGFDTTTSDSVYSQQTTSCSSESSFDSRENEHEGQLIPLSPIESISSSNDNTVVDDPLSSHRPSNNPTTLQTRWRPSTAVFEEDEGSYIEDLSSSFDSAVGGGYSSADHEEDEEEANRAFLRFGSLASWSDFPSFSTRGADGAGGVQKGRRENRRRGAMIMDVEEGARMESMELDDGVLEDGISTTDLDAVPWWLRFALRLAASKLYSSSSRSSSSSSSRGKKATRKYDQSKPMEKKRTLMQQVLWVVEGMLCAWVAWLVKLLGGESRQIKRE